MQVLVVGDAPGLVQEAAAGEARDGVTPPMRNARERVFRRPIEVAPEVVQKVEMDLLNILAVSGWGRREGGREAPPSVVAGVRIGQKLTAPVGQRLD